MKIMFVRHGKDSDEHRGGWSNLDLVPEGVLQTESLAEYLKENKEKYGISYIVTSDLQRALTTAGIIADKLNIPVLSDERLREINNGDLAGMPNSEADILYPDLYFSSLDMNEKYPNGESPIEFYERIKLWLNDFVSEYKNSAENIMVVTHGGVINVIYHIVNGIGWSNKNKSVGIDNCGMFVLDTDDMV